MDDKLDLLTSAGALQREVEILRARLHSLAGQIHDSSNMLTSLLLFSHLNLKLLAAGKLESVLKNAKLMDANLKPV